MTKIGFKLDANNLNFTDPDGTPYINACRFKYAILESVDKIEFDKLPNVNFSQLTSWQKGRLFGEKTELKWRKRHGKFHLVITTEECNLPQWTQTYSEDLEPFEAEGKPIYRFIYLWGIKEFQKDPKTGKNCPQNQWYEARIPQLLQYPVDDYQTEKTRVKVKVQEYLLREKDRQGNEFPSILQRFVGIMEVQR